MMLDHSNKLNQKCLYLTGTNQFSMFMLDVIQLFTIFTDQHVVIFGSYR